MSDPAEIQQLQAEIQRLREENTKLEADLKWCQDDYPELAFPVVNVLRDEIKTLKKDLAAVTLERDRLLKG